MGTSFTDPYPRRVTVNDRDDFSECWICGDPVDHLGVPHSKATGDGLTRYDIVEFMGDRSWRTPEPEPEQLVTFKVDGEVHALHMQLKGALDLMERWGPGHYEIIPYTHPTKATPLGPGSWDCAHCGVEIDRVPGGDGMVWVHSESRLVICLKKDKS